MRYQLDTVVASELKRYSGSGMLLEAQRRYSSPEIGDDMLITTVAGQDAQERVYVLEVVTTDLNTMDSYRNRIGSAVMQIRSCLAGNMVPGVQVKFAERGIVGDRIVSLFPKMQFWYGPRWRVIKNGRVEPQLEA